MPSRQRNVLDIKKKVVVRTEPRKAPSQDAPQPRAMRLRARRRRARLLTAGIIFLSGAGVIGALSAASHLDRLEVSDVAVSGVNRLAPESLSSTVQGALEDGGFRFFSKKNIFLYPSASIEDSLRAAFPRIRTVELSRDVLLAQAVMVTVEERKPFASWCDASGSCFVMDDQGFIFDVGGESTEVSYVFRGGLVPRDPIGQTFLRGRFHEMLALVEDLKSAGYAPEGVVVETENDFSIPLIDGPHLRLRFDMERDAILRNLEVALSADGLREKFPALEYIDLRFGNRVYYK